MKGQATASDFVKYVFHRVPMPDYGSVLQLNFHTAAPTVATDHLPTPVISGGSSRKRRRIYYDEAPLPRYGTPVKAHLHAIAASGARFAPMVAGAQLVAVQGQGAAVARLVAQVAQAVPGALAGSTDSDAALRPQLGQAVSAHAHSAHESAARFSPTITTRTVVVPLRPRVELADDELAAILYLMAA